MLHDFKPVINIDFKVEEFDNEILLYSAKDSKAIFLNEIAISIVSHCSGDKTVGEILDFFAGKYPDQEETVRKDITEVFETLSAQGAISFLNEKQ